MADAGNIPGSRELWAAGIVTHQDLVDRFGTRPFAVPATSPSGQAVFVKQP
jgi:hypothetical protein